MAVVYFKSLFSVNIFLILIYGVVQSSQQNILSPVRSLLKGSASLVDGSRSLVQNNLKGLFSSASAVLRDETTNSMCEMRTVKLIMSVYLN